MKRSFYKLTLLFFLGIPGISQSISTIPVHIKKILFLGNSITYSGQYVVFTEAYLTLKYPDTKFEFINLGLPSETVSGLSEENHAGGRFPRPDLNERLERVLQQVKPDLVFACYGMNDGIYLPFDETRFLKFREGINWLHNQVVKSGANIIHLTPPVFDERKGMAYANVLDIYSDWLISCRYTSAWEVIDIHRPMRKYLEDKRTIDSTFVLAVDGVHPGETGHWIISREILKYLGENNLVKKDDLHDVFNAFPNGEAVLKLIKERQEVMKDAWLNATGHKRPEMNPGVSLSEAERKAVETELKIRELLK